MTVSWQQDLPAVVHGRDGAAPRVGEVSIRYALLFP